MNKAIVLSCILLLVIPGVGRCLDTVPATNTGNTGDGFDSATGEIRGQCVLGQQSSAPSSAGSVEFTLRHFTRASEIRSSLNMRASASLGFGVYKGSASFALSQSSSSSSYHEHLFVNVDVVNRRMLLEKPAMTNEAVKLYRNDRAKFRERCGDHFLVGVITGGSFSAIFSAESQTDEQQSDARATLSAAALKGSLDTEVEQKLSKLESEGRLSVSIARKGPNEVLPALTVTELTRYARELPTKVKAGSGNDWDIYYIVRDYATIAPASTVPKSDQDLWLDELGDYLERLASYRAGLLHMVRSAQPNGLSAEFGRFSVARAEHEVNDVHKEMDKIRAEAVACAQKAAQCKRRELPFVKQTPRRRSVVAMNPRIPGWQAIARTSGVDPIVVEGQGGWWPHCPPEPDRKLMPWNESAVIQVIDIISGKTTTLGISRPFLLPGGANVDYQILDNPHHDNCVGPEGLSFSIYFPLYPDEFSRPEELQAP